MTSKKLGFWSIVLLAINSIVGSGIFLTPGVVITMVGKLGPLAYIAAALLAACLAVTFAVAAKYVTKKRLGIRLCQSCFRVAVWILHGNSPLLLRRCGLGGDGSQCYQINPLDLRGRYQQLLARYCLLHHPDGDHYLD